MAASHANTAGLRKSLFVTSDPSRNVVVADAAAASAGSGDRTSLKWSATSIVDTPLSSSWRASSRHAAPEAGTPQLTPKRIGATYRLRVR